MGSYLTGLVVAGLVVTGMLSLLTFTQEGQVQTVVDAVSEADHAELISLAEGNDQDLKLEAILKLGENPGNLEETVPLLSHLLLSHRSSLVRTAAGIALREIGEAAIPVLEPMIMSNDVAELSAACSAAREIGAPSKVFLPRVKVLLDDENYQIQKRGLYVLQGMGPDAIELIDEVIECLDVPRETLRQNPESFNNQLMACRTLEQFGADALPAEETLLEILREGNPSSKSYAALVLGAIGPTDKTDTARVLADNLKEPLQIQKQRTLLGLAYMGREAEKVADEVRALMNDQSKHVMPHAAYALWKLTGEPKESLDVMASLLDDRDYVDDTLELLGQMQGDAAPLVSKIAAKLKSHEEPTIEMAIVALGNIGAPSAKVLGELRPLLSHEDALIRYYTRDSIKKIKQAVAEQKK